MPGRDPRRDIIASTGALVVDALSADEAFVAWIAEPEIERRIAEGELVPTSALTIAGGLELVRVGVVAELRAALLDLATHPKVAAVKEVADLIDVCKALAGAPAVAAAKPAKKAKAAPEPKVEPEPEPQPEVERDRTSRRPRNMPALPQQCVCCGAELDEMQLALAWTRHRAPVCKDDMANYTAEKAS